MLASQDPGPTLECKEFLRILHRRLQKYNLFSLAILSLSFLFPVSIHFSPIHVEKKDNLINFEETLLNLPVDSRDNCRGTHTNTTFNVAPLTLKCKTVDQVLRNSKQWFSFTLATLLSDPQVFVILKYKIINFQNTIQIIILHI